MQIVKEGIKINMYETHIEECCDYFSPFNKVEFCKMEAKYLESEFYPLTIERDQIYKINLFKTHEKKLQIGLIGYGGIFPVPETEKQLLEILQDVKIKFGEIDTIIMPPFAPIQLSECRGYNIENRYTAVLDLDKYRKKQFSTFKCNVRTAIRSATKKGVIVERCCREEELEAFYSLYIATMQRVGANYLTAIEFMREIIFDSNIGSLILAKYNNEVIAGSLFLESNKQTFYWINASSYEHRSLNANYAILYYEISEAREKGKRYFNFGYSHKESIQKSKMAWGCELVPYVVLKNTERGGNAKRYD